MKRLLVTSLLVLAACNPQLGSAGLEGITSMKTPVDDPNLGCGVQLPADTLASQREACTFGRGATPSATVGIDSATAAKIPIRHVIVMMKENRSFDHLLGKLHDLQPDTEAIPAGFTNPDLDGVQVPMSRAPTTCLALDPEHQFNAMTRAIDKGAMDGFVKNAALSTKSDGHFIMSYYEPTDLPFVHFLANTYALSDRHFAPAQSGTFCDRNFVLYGSNQGAVDTGIVFPDPNTPSLLHLIQNAGFTWGAFSDDEPFEGTLGWTTSAPGAHSMQALYDALDQGTLPNVSFVDARWNTEDDHPLADLQKGEAWSKKIYDHAVTSPQWKNLAIVYTYDEGGGFPDHVVPPSACLSEPGSPFKDLGVRVPLVMISPWAKRHFVSHAVHDHTAITRFIATLFDLPALTARDANSDDLLDLFDFSCGRDLTVPAAPAVGSGGCASPP
jgi:phospholipase C